MIFASIRDFRDHATEQDLAELEAFILAQPKRAEAFPCEQYGFSYTSASSYLREQGYLGGRKEPDDQQPEIPIFSIRSDSCLRDAVFVNRTLSVQENILQRLDQMAEVYWMYSKKAILNSLLDEILKEYGY